MKNFKTIDAEGAVVLTREEYDSLLDNILNLSTKIELYQGLLNDMAGVRKETVDKFAELAKAKARWMRDHHGDYTAVDIYDIDEIAKEIMEGRYDSD